MATAVTVVFGANSTQFQAELKRMDSMAAASAARMSHAGGAHGPRGMTGIIRESAVIGREIAMGRGLGRILGSMSLLVMYLKSFLGAAKQANTGAQELAAGYEMMALRANLAAKAAMKKAEASAAAAYAEDLENLATVAAADADSAKAVSAMEAAAATQAKAAAAAEAAEASELEAIASTEATAASIPIVAIFIGLIAVLAVVYAGYKLISTVLHHFAEMHIKAAEQARESTLNYKEEARALEKLAEAAKRTEDALRKMNEVHNDTAKNSEDVLKAMEKEADAQRHLYNVRKESALLAVDADLQSGKITPEVAAQRKANIEKQAIDDVRNYKVIELKALRDKSAIDAQNAAKQAEADQKAAKAASDKVNATPEGRANALELGRLEKLEERTRKAADDAADKAVKMPYNSAEKAREERHAEMMNNLANAAHAQVEEQRSRMSPDELAASDLMKKAEESTKAAGTMSQTHAKYLGEWKDAVNDKTGQAADEQEKKNIDAKAAMDIQKIEARQGRDRGYSLNSQQRVGAYAATAPILVQQLNRLDRIVVNTTPHHPPTNHPPGPRKPQLGTVPPGARTHGHSGGVIYSNS